MKILLQCLSCLLDDDNDFFISGILQGDTLASFLFIIYLELCTMNVNKSNERKWFHTRKGKKLMISCRNYY